MLTLREAQPGSHARSNFGERRERRLVMLAAWLLFGGTIFGLGVAAVDLAPRGSDVAAWWPAAGVAVAAVVVWFRYRWWWALGIVVFSCLANLAGGRPWHVSIGFGVANAGEALGAGWCLQRWSGGRPALLGLRDMTHLVGAALVGAATIAVGAAITVSLFTDGAVDKVVLSVMPSHAAAVLLIVPLALSTKAVIKRLPEALAWWTFVAAASAVLFARGEHRPLAFVVFVPLVWSALRLGLRAVSLQLIAVGVAVTALTAHGAGSFATAVGTDSARTVQVFLTALALVVLPLAVAMSERERALHRVRASEELFRGGFEEALVGMMLMRVEGPVLRVVEVNPAAERKLYLTAGDVVGPELVDDDRRTLPEVVGSLQPGHGWRGEMNYEAADGGPLSRYAVAVSQLMDESSKASVTCQIVDVTARYHADLELEHMALHDHLTGLANRVLLDIRLKDELVNAEASGRGLAVMFIDLDDFKMVNDTSGHRSGDEILIEIARRLAARIRPEDTIARMGGDEFVLICPGVTDGDDAISLAERLWTTVDDAIELGNLSYKVHLSIGVAVSSPGSTAGQMLSHADIALYAAKHAGKSRVTLYSADLGATAAKQVELEAELSVARNEQQFEIYYQPVINMSSGTIEAVEALIRWHHPTRGLLLPGAFLAAAERCGMMSDIGPWVLDQSCRQAAAWVDQFGADAPTVHVNVSTRQLDAISFADNVLATVRAHNLSPYKLVLELTETYLAEVDATLFAQFEALATHGIGLAADDYGTGYSPLTRITELPVSMIKIDQQFVRGIGTDPRSRAVVASLVSLARTLQLEVVAEGVETTTQARILQEIGIALAQGFLWHKAMPAQSITALLGVGATPSAHVVQERALPPAAMLR